MTPDIQEESSKATNFSGAAEAERRPRGRPPRLSRAEVLEAIRDLAAHPDGLFRVHRDHADLYARARRFFGSWAEAVRMAGLDYETAIRTARSRSRARLRKRAPAARPVNDRT